jgi:hypothetical protein
MTATFLVTLIFLLSDGTPVNKGVVHCDGINLINAYEEDQPISEAGTALQLDSRGGSLMTVWSPTTIICALHYRGEWWRGAISLSKHGQVEIRYLWGDS